MSPLYFPIRGNHGSLVGRVFRVPGVVDAAIGFHDDWILVADSDSPDLTVALSLVAWIQPLKSGTQYVIKNARSDEADGYEIGLTGAGRVFFRLNQLSEGNTYKLISNRSRPADGGSWMHVAAMPVRRFDASAGRHY